MDSSIRTDEKELEQELTKRSQGATQVSQWWAFVSINLISVSVHVCAVSNAALTNQFALFMFCRCKCGNCSVLLLQNISECYCCSQLEGCLESTKTDLILLDIGADVTLKCIVQHPGFNPVCLQKWSLRLAAGKFKTKGNNSADRKEVRKGQLMIQFMVKSLCKFRRRFTENVLTCDRWNKNHNNNNLVWLPWVSVIG